MPVVAETTTRANGLWRPAGIRPSRQVRTIAVLPGSSLDHSLDYGFIVRTAWRMGQQREWRAVGAAYHRVMTAPGWHGVLDDS